MHVGIKSIVRSSFLMFGVENGLLPFKLPAILRKLKHVFKTNYNSALMDLFSKYTYVNE